MNFSEIFKKSFIAGFTTADISTKSVLVTLGITCVFALYVFFVYRIVTRKTFYRQSFNVALAMISVIVATIVLAIQSNIVVSLGMVGALSIVRFRTAIKDPMDLMFLFWSIAVGIVVAAGLPGIAFIASALITLGIIFFELLPLSKAPMLLIINANSSSKREEIIKCIKENAAFYSVKSQTYESEKLDMIVEVRTKEEGKLLDAVNSLNGIRRCSLVNHDGEVTF